MEVERTKSVDTATTSRPPSDCALPPGLLLASCQLLKRLTCQTNAFWKNRLLASLFSLKVLLLNTLV